MKFASLMHQYGISWCFKFGQICCINDFYQAITLIRQYVQIFHRPQHIKMDRVKKVLGCKDVTDVLYQSVCMQG